MKSFRLLALLLAALLPDPARGATRQITELRGTTTLVGSQGAVVLVRVPQAATLAFDPSTDVEGDGAFVGFALSKYPVDLQTIPPFPPFPRLGSVLVAGRVSGSIAYISSPGAQIAAGEYLLYLLADDSPARVTFRLSGLDGALELVPADPARFDARVLTPLATVEADQVVYSAGQSGELFAPGVALTFLWLAGQAVADQYLGNSGLYGNCLYNHQAGDDPPDETVAYLPGCPWIPQSEFLFVFPAVMTPGTAGIQLGWLNYLAVGRWGQGAWYASPSLVDTAGAAVFWLTLDAPALPTPALVQPATVKAESDRVRITWFCCDAGLVANVYRSTGAAEWDLLSRLKSDGTGLMVFEDRDVAPGARLGYRLGFPGVEGEQPLGEIWVDVPDRLALRLEGANPNPASGEATIEYTLPRDAPALIEVMDVTGRRLLRREVGGQAGRHVLPLAEAGRLPAGVYLVRLTQEMQSVSGRVVVAR